MRAEHPPEEGWFGSSLDAKLQRALREAVEETEPRPVALGGGARRGGRARCAPARATSAAALEHDHRARCHLVGERGDGERWRHESGWCERAVRKWGDGWRGGCLELGRRLERAEEHGATFEL